jgi:hypothetical protein
LKSPPGPRSPPQRRTTWAKTPIDAFILARLKKEGLHPSPEADKATLIRRVTLDLTGLLPTPAEVRAFENDTRRRPMSAWWTVARQAEFGEERARYWLDYARYADTYGLHYDNSRDIWPYRDYLIRSFNSNKPFDQFAMEQIAGDLLPAKNLDPLIASGYVRLGVSSNEGGTIPEELRVNIARERTEAYGATFMGLTLGCAVCHDHKYDPTTQKDFYALSAFFNNLEEKPFNDDRPVWAPVARIPRPQNQEEYNRVLAKRSELAERSNAAPARARAGGAVDSVATELPQPVSTDKLDAAPAPGRRRRRGTEEQRAACAAGQLSHRQIEAAMGRDDLAVARFPHGHQHPYPAGPDRRLRMEPGVFFRRLVHDAPRRTTRWTMRRARSYRRWIPPSTTAAGIFRSKGIVSVELVNQGPKDLVRPQSAPASAV